MTTHQSTQLPSDEVFGLRNLLERFCGDANVCEVMAVYMCGCVEIQLALANTHDPSQSLKTQNTFGDVLTVTDMTADDILWKVT